MSGGALGQLRRLFGEVNTDAVHLAARLLDAIEVSRDILAPVAEEATPAGIAAGLAFQILADAATEAAPPPAAT